MKILHHTDNPRSLPEPSFILNDHAYRVFHLHHLPGGFINDYRRLLLISAIHIGILVGTERFAFQQGHSQCLHKIAVPHNTDHFQRIDLSVFTHPTENGFFRLMSPKVIRQVHASRHIPDIRIFHYFLPIIIYSLVAVVGHQFEYITIHDDHIFLIQSEVCILQVMKLTEDYRSGKKHRNGNDKLHTYQAFDKRPFPAGCLSAFKGQQRVERRHIESRERPRQTPDSYYTEQGK